MYARISKKGQVTIPKTIRKKLNVDKEGGVLFLVENDEVKIKGIPGAQVDQLAGSLKKYAETCEFNLIEPFFTQSSLEAQLSHLKQTLDHYVDEPIILVGHSWGAWLAFLFAARFQQWVKKLILIGAGPFEASYATQILPARLASLPERAQQTVFRLSTIASQPGRSLTPAQFKILGELLSQADCYDCMEFDQSELEYLPEVHAAVWPVADTMRASGQLIAAGESITCPVIAIHGDHDPHPAEGVEIPLSRVLNDFQFYLIPACGHYPWYERQAREVFFKVLKEALKKA